jgi:hypothetical protein
MLSRQDRLHIAPEREPGRRGDVMPELPDRPDLDQLRRQARELLRAATHDEPGAVARLRAVSDRVTLSAAQLALAREYGYRSWPALKAEVERRRLSQPAGKPPAPGGDEQGPVGAPGERWSFGGAAGIRTSAGVLLPEAVIVSGRHATLYASLIPGDSQPFLVQAVPGPPPRVPLARWAWRRRVTRARRRYADVAVTTMRTLARPDEIAVVDDRGASYALRPQGGSSKPGPSGEPAGHRSVRFWLDPLPRRGTGWLELRGQDGAAARLLPSARPAVRVGQLAPVTVSPAERELTDLAMSLIELQLTSTGELPQDVRGQRCSAALARMEEIQRSGELGAASELPDQLRQLCAVLTRHGPADQLPASWSGMLSAARRDDGPRHLLDIGAALPPIDGVVVLADSLISAQRSWQLYLRVTPSWWRHGEDDRRQRTRVTVHARDDRGGTYVSCLGRTTRHRDPEEPAHEETIGRVVVALRFLPRLDPRARALTLTFRGADEEIAIDLPLA